MLAIISILPQLVFVKKFWLNLDLCQLVSIMCKNANVHRYSMSIATNPVVVNIFQENFEVSGKKNW